MKPSAKSSLTTSRFRSSARSHYGVSSVEADAERATEVFLSLVAIRRDRSDDLAESRRERIDCANACRRTEPSFRLTGLLKRQRR